LLEPLGRPRTRPAGVGCVPDHEKVQVKGETPMAKEETTSKKEAGQAVVPRRPPLELSRTRREIDRLFDEFMRPGVPFGVRWPERLFGRWPADLDLRAPALDVFEEKDAVVVKAEVPGMTKDDVRVDVAGDVLTLRGEKKKEEKIEEDDYYCQERTYGAFTRSVRLPVEVRAEKATATFKNGVLELRLPKSEDAKRQRVSIKVK
jgi:HSP20 family protein